MFRAWFPDSPADLSRRFAAATLTRNLTMAELQQHLLLHKDSPEDAASLHGLVLASGMASEMAQEVEACSA